MLFPNGSKRSSIETKQRERGVPDPSFFKTGPGFRHSPSRKVDAVFQTLSIEVRPPVTGALPHRKTGTVPKIDQIGQDKRDPDPTAATALGMKTEPTFSITNTTRGRLPRLPFLAMKHAVLGRSYRLSLVFIGSTRSRNLTKAYRKKDKASNVLSFPLEKNEGEIFITPAVARTQAKNFDTTPEKFIGFLFIHGLLHLKGYGHGSKMEAMEQALSRRFNV